MKTRVNILVTITLITFAITANSQCVQCDNNSNALGSYSSVIGMSTTTTANSDGAFAGGYGSTAEGAFAFAFGNQVTAAGTNSLAIGRFLETSATPAMVLGVGYDLSHKLIDSISNSLMIGFNSDKPTFFVGPSNGVGTTGKIGIGNVTDPLAKLHIKGDENGSSSEDADILLEPGSSMKYARVKFGTTGNKIEARESQDMNFHTASDFVFWDANVGIGTDNPAEKLVVTGNILINEINAGLVLMSPDGNCWKITVDNQGNLAVVPDSCMVTTDKPVTGEDSHVVIYPNPAGQKINVKVPVSFNEVLISIYDEGGVLLHRRKLSSGENRLSLRKFPKGILIIKVTRENGEMVAMEKIIHN